MELNPFKTIVLLMALLATALGLHAQNLKPADDLYKEIVHQDSVLFDAFNNQKLDVMKSVFAKDLEFYHDKGGLTNYEQNIDAFKTNFEANKGLHRELVPGSMEVYPIKDYGAVQIASHTFCHLQNRAEGCGTFKFIHVWHKTPEGWKLARVVSVGH